jgi:hypothetical protein
MSIRGVLKIAAPPQTISTAEQFYSFDERVDMAQCAATIS